MTPRRRKQPAQPDRGGQFAALGGFAAHLRAKIATARADLVHLEHVAAAPDAPPGARAEAEAARLALESDVDALPHVRATLRKNAPPERRTTT